MYGTVIISKHIETVYQGEFQEVEFQFTLNCVNRGNPGRVSGPPEHCYPPEGAEFELESIHVLDEDCKLIRVSEEVLTAIIGKEAFTEMLSAAETEADESGEF